MRERRVAATASSSLQQNARSAELWIQRYWVTAVQQPQLQQGQKARTGDRERETEEVGRAGGRKKERERERHGRGARCKWMQRGSCIFASHTRLRTAFARRWDRSTTGFIRVLANSDSNDPREAKKQVVTHTLCYAIYFTARSARLPPLQRVINAPNRPMTTARCMLLPFASRTPLLQLESLDKKPRSLL